MSSNVAAQPAAGANLAGLLRRNEVWMAAAAIGIVMMLVLPLPTPLLDLLLVANVAFSLAVLLVTTYLHSPLEFSVFPSLLLFTALFRLGLSISVMRAILSHAEAGTVVAAFGNMVLGGNYVIGFVLFLTLVIVQFIVVTGGTSRIAEVVARFTLDAMPGKQMAIDADLNAGSITEDEARQRRRQVAQEADFYGAMDGASKFVKGDGIAALVITAICILGGIVIGVVQLRMDLVSALELYALLTVGQGLVVQIPGLLMSAASGLIVTRAAAEGNLSDDLIAQITSRTEALTAAGVGCCALAVMPGLPKLPLLVLGAALILGARRLAALQRERAAAPEPTDRPAPQQTLDMAQHLPLDALELEIGYGLVPLAMQSEGGQLLERITGLRKQLAQELGLIVPPIRVRDNVSLDPNHYLLRLRGVAVAEGDILPRFFLALNGGEVKEALDGDHTNDPTFGLPALWVSPDERSEAQRRGYIVIDAASVCVTHLGEALRGQAARLLTRQELSKLLEVARADNPAVVDDLVPDAVSKAVLQQVLQNLLHERVPVRDLVGILEALGEVVPRTGSIDEMAEYVRRRLARAILTPLAPDGRELPALVLEPQLEKRLAETIGETSFGGQLQLSPELMQTLVDGLGKQVEALANDGHQPVLVCSSRLRLPLRRLLCRFISRLVVVAYDEVAEAGVTLRTLGMVQV